MKRKNATRSALFTSIISLLLCVSMLVGTTFAWFTDEVKSGVNTIAAGNLDVELYHGKDANPVDKVDEGTMLFTDVGGNVIDQWEPGVVAFTNLKVANVGTLALKYQLSINSTEMNYVEGTDLTLADALKVAVVEGGVSGTREQVIGAVDASAWTKLESFTLPGVLEADKKSETYGIVIYWEPGANEHDNQFNMNNGKTTSDGEPLTITLGVNLFATQEMYEDDSFGPDYDSLASAWDGTIGEVPAEENGVITITTGAELAAFAVSVNNGTNYSGKTIKLGADINLGNQDWTPIGACNSAAYFQGIFDGQGHTIYNLSVDKSNDGYKYSTAGLFGWIDAAATIKNVNLENATVIGSHWVGALVGYLTGTVENCTVNNSIVMGFDVNDDANGDKVGGLVGYMNSGAGKLDGNTVKNTTVSGKRDVAGLAGAVATTNTVTNNKVENVAITYDKDYVGQIVSPKTAVVVDTTNTATDVTITRVITAKTAAELNSALAALSGDALNTAAILQNCNEPDGIVLIPAAYTGTLTLKDSSIASVDAANAANLVIAGTVKVENAEGSAITGKILNISGNGNLTAIANDSVNDKTHYYGIGGNQTESINIENVHIVKVAGGLVNPKVTSSWGKKDVEGGAAIGSGYTGAVITLNNVTVDEALGGSKAAGIGGRYHTGVTVNINNSVIKNVVGGANSAAIGGSRMTKSTTTGAENNITVNIKNSKINATGGDFGAAIGSGYNTYTNEIAITPVISVTIDDASEITAQGGWLGAGIGTGHNAIGFVGNIACDTSNVKAGSSVEPVKVVDGIDCCYGAATTVAQDVGYGVLKVEAFPEIAGKYVSNADELAAAVAEGATKLYLADGEYNIYGCGGKTLTLNGSKNAVIKPVNEGEWGCDYGFDSATVVFNGITIDTTEMTANASGQSPNYPGFARISATYNNCTIKGTYALNKDAVFTNCEFFVEGDRYNVWTWGASKANFTECTFNCDGKSILMYNVSCDLTAQKCTFNDNGNISDKAAIETGVDGVGPKYNITLIECTVNGFDVNPKGSAYLNIVGNKNSLTAEYLNVVIDGVDVY